MKFAKLSVAAILAVGFTTSAVAEDSKITFNPFGSAKLYYETIAHDGATDGSEDLFNSKGASGGALMSLGATGKINSCFGYGFEGMGVNTLGLENNLVSGTRMSHGRDSDILDSQFWFPQAYITYHPCDMGTNTTFKVGRQYLDTPLAFTERWNLAPNSFDAIVAINQDIINTTIVGAYVGRGNGVKVAVSRGDDFRDYGFGTDSVDGTLAGAGAHLGKSGGAYALGIITNLLDGALPISLWGYDVNNVANALWADAGYKLDLGDGMKFDLGAQYGYMSPDDDSNSLVTGALGVANPDDTTGYGVKIGGSVNVADMNFGLTAAYSTVDDDGVLSLANTATIITADNTVGAPGGKKTKLYTAGIYTDGTGVAVPGSDAFKIKATTKLAGIGGLAVQYVSCENDTKYASGMTNVDEIDVILSTGILPGGLNTKLIYMNRDVDDKYDNNKGLTDDTDHIRLILSKKF